MEAMQRKIDNHESLSRGLSAAAVIGTILRFLAALLDSPSGHLFSDPARHWDNAVNFLKPGLMGGCDPILYQAYLFVVGKLTLGNGVLIGLVTGLLSAVMPWLYYRAARSFDMPRVWARACWVAMAWLPSFWAIYRYFMMETLLLPLIGLGLWMSGRAMRKRDVPSFLLMAVVWTLAILTKAQAIPLAAVFGVYAFGLVRGKVRALVLALVIFGLMLAPNAFRSKGVLGFYAPLGSGYIARIMHESGAMHTRFFLNSGTWIYSSPSCYVAPLDPLNGWRIERGVAGTTHKVHIDLARGRDDWEAALADAKRPARGKWQHAWENVVLFLFAPSWPDSGQDYLMGWLNYHSRWIWAPIVFHVLIGNLSIFWRRLFPVIPVATSVMIALLMFQNSVTMEGRYRKPLEAMLVLNALWLWTPAARRAPASSRPMAGADTGSGAR